MLQMDLNKHEVYKKVIKYCHRRLFKDKAAMAYLKEARGLSEETIRKFKIGLFPQNLKELYSIVDARILRESEIIIHASKSKYQKNDIVMPVRDVYGNYIAIVGRTRLNDEERAKFNVNKYYNSPYKKRNHLFGLNLAKRSILENGIAYVVEGQFDVITPHQHGMTNVVATCSGSMSTNQVILLSRYTDRIVLLFDNEPIAQQRAQQVVKKHKQQNISLTSRTPFPPNTKDIDEFIRKNSIKELYERLESGGEFDAIRPSWD